MDRHTTKQNLESVRCNLGSVIQCCADALRSELPGFSVLGRGGNHTGKQCSRVISILSAMFLAVIWLTSKVFCSRAESGMLVLWRFKD